MSVFTQSSGGYKGGVFLLIFAAVAFVVGFGAPYWASQSYGQLSVEFEVHEGPWMLCASVSSFGISQSSCGSYGFSLADWFHAVRALEAICLVVLIVACIYAMATNCCRTIPGPRTRILEILAGAGGVLGLIGVIVYGALRDEEVTSDSSFDLIAYNFLLGGNEWTFGWALYLAGVGSGLAIVAAVIIGVCNNELAQLPAGNTFGMSPVTVVNTQQSTSYPGYASHPGYAAQGGYPAQAGYPAQGGYPGHGGHPHGGYPPAQAGYGYPMKH